MNEQTDDYDTECECSRMDAVMVEVDARIANKFSITLDHNSVYPQTHAFIHAFKIMRLLIH